MPTLIDPARPPFAATFTSAVLALVLLTAPGPLATTLLAAQAAVFAVGALAGVQHTPYAWLFRTLVRPRLGTPDELEDAAPPRFAQAVGLAFALVGLVGLAGRAHHARAGRRRPRAGGRVAQRGRSVSAWAARSTCSSSASTAADTSRPPPPTERQHPP